MYLDNILRKFKFLKLVTVINYAIFEKSFFAFVVVSSSK
jgi:hypothetical protein